VHATPNPGPDRVQVSDDASHVPSTPGWSGPGRGKRLGEFAAQTSANRLSGSALFETTVKGSRAAQHTGGEQGKGAGLRGGRRGNELFARISKRRADVDERGCDRIACACARGNQTEQLVGGFSALEIEAGERLTRLQQSRSCRPLDADPLWGRDESVSLT